MSGLTSGCRSGLANQEAGTRTICRSPLPTSFSTPSKLPRGRRWLTAPRCRRLTRNAVSIEAERIWIRRPLSELVTTAARNCEGGSSWRRECRRGSGAPIMRKVRLAWRVCGLWIRWPQPRLSPVSAGHRRLPRSCRPSKGRSSWCMSRLRGSYQAEWTAAWFTVAPHRGTSECS